MRKVKLPAIVIPLANEEQNFPAFFHTLKKAIQSLPAVTVYFVIDHASKDNTLALCLSASETDARFKTIFEPMNANVVDAYLRGFGEALNNQHDLIIEMDGGLSHDPNQLKQFVEAYEQGYDVVFGSRFMTGSKTEHYNFKRKVLSRLGTVMAKVFLGIKLKDATSGYEAFDAAIVQKILQFPIRSRGHFFQTELRYLCRKLRVKEIPISYCSPSASISRTSIYNAISTLFYYFLQRLILKSKAF